MERLHRQHRGTCRDHTRGFTLIELMIVVVIIGILAALAIPRFANSGREARNAEAPRVLKQICTLANAEAESGTPPSDIGAIIMFEDPGANSRFIYSYAPRTATATALDGTVDTQTMDCTTV